MLQAIALSKSYQSHLALDNLNLDLCPGEIFCLLGQNGAGKTTTINLLLGFIQPSSGKILLNGQDVTLDGNALRQHLAYIPEVVMLYGNLTALENLDYFSQLAGFRYSDQELATFLTASGLQEDAQRKRLQYFSKGMRQKVGIAIALAKKSQVILMDEPTSGLDPKASDEFTALVQSLGKKGTSVLMATHDLFNAVNVGTRIGIMRRGQLVHTRSAAEISATDLQKLYLQTI